MSLKKKTLNGNVVSNRDFGSNNWRFMSPNKNEF